jgi:hypothetical protein
METAEYAAPFQTRAGSNKAQSFFASILYEQHRSYREHRDPCQRPENGRIRAQNIIHDASANRSNGPCSCDKHAQQTIDPCIMCRSIVICNQGGPRGCNGPKARPKQSNKAEHANNVLISSVKPEKRKQERLALFVSLPPGKKTSTLDIHTIICYNKTSILDKKESLLYIPGDDEHLERTVLMMNQSASKDQSVSKTYTREFLTAMITYAVVLLVSVFLLQNGPSEAWWRIPLALTPMIPIFFALRASLRYFQRVDELQKRIQLEAFALSFGLTCLVTFCYGLLEYAGFPALNWTWVPAFMMTFWGISVAITSLRYR